MSTFTVVIHEEPTGGFWGEVPTLPGCYSQGETVDELLGNLREAIAGVLDVIAVHPLPNGRGSVRIR
jgi:predicted RNase H-like HicB family nuclease